MGVGAGLYMYVVVVQKFTFAISSPDEFLSFFWRHLRDRELSSPRLVQSASWQSASWRIRELSSYRWARGSMYYMGVRIGATWRIQLNRQCAAAMRPCVKLL